MPGPDRSPSFPLDPADFLGDEWVVAFDCLPGLGRHVALAGYFRLVCRLWAQPEPGKIGLDEERLASLSGLGKEWSRYREPILRCFEIRDGIVIQKRMVRERELQLIRYRKAVEYGKRGGRKNKRTNEKEGTLKAPSREPQGSQSYVANPIAVQCSAVQIQNQAVPRTELSTGPPRALPAGTAGLRSGETKPAEPGTVAGMSSIGEVLQRVMPHGMPRNLGAVTGADLDTPEGRERERQAQLAQLRSGAENA